MSDAHYDEFDVLLKAGDKPSGGGWQPTPKGFKRRRGGKWEYYYPHPDGKPGKRVSKKKQKKGGGTDIPEYKLHVTGESHEEVARKLKEGIDKSADICKTNPSVCHGNLGIERKDMPQFDTDANPNVIKDYLDEFRKEGVKVEQTSIPAGQLKATQKEIQTAKAYGMAKAYHEHKEGKNEWAPNKAPVVVSSDGYILDGHHRWAATTIADPAAHMPVYRVNAPIKKLLEKSEKFYKEGRGVKKADFKAESIGVKKSMTAEAYLLGRWHERINKAISDATEAMGEALRKASPYEPPREESFVKSLDSTFESVQRDEIAFRMRAADRLVRPEVVVLPDGRPDPYQELAKSIHSQPYVLGERAAPRSGGDAAQATIDADCLIHSMRDLTKSMNLSNVYAHCTCPHG